MIFGSWKDWRRWWCPGSGKYFVQISRGGGVQVVGGVKLAKVEQWLGDNWTSVTVNPEHGGLDNLCAPV